MSWNDDRDPKSDDRGRNSNHSGNSQQPPDLGEVFGNLSKNLEKLLNASKKKNSFEPKRNGGGSGGGNQSNPFDNIPIKSFLIGVFFVLTILYVGSGFYTVDQQERGAVFRFGQLQEAISMPGLRWNPPLIDKVQVINVTQVRETQHSAQMLTKDLNFVDMRVTVQWVIDDVKKYVTLVEAPELSLKHATESALRNVVGNSLMEFVITRGRIALAKDVESRIQSYINNYGTGILINTLNINEALPPDEVKEAFDDVQKAKEDKERLENEAKAYAEALIPQARGEAEKELANAKGYMEKVVSRAEGDTDRFLKLLKEYELAPSVTRHRMYIDAMETVLQNTTKVLIDVKNGQNLLYLPLDRMIPQLDRDRNSTNTQRTDSSSVRDTSSQEAMSNVESLLQKFKERGRTR